ncbi:MAG TPA: CDP-diacylglycerol--serine O-phosphatidyltransferase [Gammaproteobacteria bacterium]|nr:CDP-diacylglycerol--serine O-phosphatidyltransferase [Gammaproteobacteria bacterium]
MTRRPRKRVAQQTRDRLRGLNFNRLIPNILTVLALCAGLTAVLYGYQSKWKFAVIAILVAAVLDALDGRVARLLGGSTKFGAELDSLSDFVSFGVAPALLVFLWSLQGAHEVGWVTALVFSVCAALRLARFNTRLGVSDMPSWASNFFTGIPAPAAGGLALLPMILSFAFKTPVLAHPLINIPVMVTVACLMISRIPTYALKQVHVPHHLVMPLLLGVGLTAALLAMATWLTVSAYLVAYLISIPFSIRSYRRQERAAASQGGARTGNKRKASDHDVASDRVFEDIAEESGEDESFADDEQGDR